MLHRIHTAREQRIEAMLRSVLRTEADQLHALAFVLNGNLPQSDRFCDALAPVSAALDAAWDEADSIANPEPDEELARSMRNAGVYRGARIEQELV